MLSLWFEGGRWFYNQSVETMENGEFEFTPSFITLYDICKTSVWDRLVDVPYQVKKIACRDAERAMKAGKKKCKLTGEKFKLKFRSRKAPVQSMFIPKSAVKAAGVFHTMLGVMKAAEPIPTVGIGDSRLVLDHGRYFLCVPVSENQAEQSTTGICAMDPGIRTFQTIFGIKDGIEIVGKFGEAAWEKILGLCLQADRIISKLKTAPTRKRKGGLKRALNRLKWRIWDLVDELHNKVVRFMADNFAVVLLPTFEVSQMVTKQGGRKIRSKSVRGMLSLAHYRFGQKMEQAGIEVHRVNEAYTSKTDSWSGVIHPTLGGAKTIKMVDGSRVDRDINGARGIFLRAMGDILSLGDPVRRVLETKIL